MLRYSCYFFDQDRRLLARQEFDAHSEFEAIVTARVLAAPHKEPARCTFEIWQGFRLIEADAHQRETDIASNAA
jgi:hypothetical protein